MNTDLWTISGEREWAVTSSSATSTTLAQRLLRAAEPQLDVLTSRLVGWVAGDLDRSDGPSHWTSAAPGWVREFLECLVADDGDRILAPGSVFEMAGDQAAREGVRVETLVSAIHVANRLTQAQVHRTVIEQGADEDTEVTLELLDRVLRMGELVVTAAQRGHALVLAETSDDEVLAQRLASELVHGGASVDPIAARLGWGPTDLVVAVVAPPGVAVAVREGSDGELAWLRREHDIVLALPVRADTMATSLRSRLEGYGIAVGPAVPRVEFPDSVRLAERTSDLLAEGEGAVFADDHLMEMVAGSDQPSLRALRRKYFSEIDRLPASTRTELLDTLREWLLHWGHRPSIAAALYVHPQTVSGRISRLKDLLEDDLEDPTTRSELLVLLTAERAA